MHVNRRRRERNLRIVNSLNSYERGVVSDEISTELEDFAVDFAKGRMSTEDFLARQRLTEVRDMFAAQEFPFADWDDEHLAVLAEVVEASREDIEAFGTPRPTETAAVEVEAPVAPVAPAAPAEVPVAVPAATDGHSLVSLAIDAARECVAESGSLEVREAVLHVLRSILSYEGADADALLDYDDSDD